jgi:hypothetical protein
MLKVLQNIERQLLELAKRLNDPENEVAFVGVMDIHAYVEKEIVLLQNEQATGSTVDEALENLKRVG